MSTEKMKVLEMLQQGTITTDEALKLLEQLPDGSIRELREKLRNVPVPLRHMSQGHRPHRPLPNRPMPHRPMSPREDYGANFDFVSRLRSNVVGFTKQFESAFGKDAQDSIEEGMRKIARQFEYAFWEDNTLLQSEAVTEIKSLSLSGKNDSVEISGYDGDAISVELFYSLKSNADPMFSLDENNGRYSLYYDSNAVYALKVVAKIPNKLVEYLNAETKNAGIRLRNLRFGEARLSTKNAAVTLEDLNGERLYAETKSATVHANNLKLSALELATSNASINLDKVSADHASLYTTNASIRTRDSAIRKLRAATTNAGLHFDYSAGVLNSQSPEYSLSAKTTNAGIDVLLPKAIPLRLKAATSVGFVSADRADLLYKTKSNNYVEASTDSYDEAAGKISVDLQTSNAGITIINA